MKIGQIVMLSISSTDGAPWPVERRDGGFLLDGRAVSRRNDGVM
jgi:hypothetical protein